MLCCDSAQIARSVAAAGMLDPVQRGFSWHSSLPGRLYGKGMLQPIRSHRTVDIAHGVIE
jgi:hypothetical protein